MSKKKNLKKSNVDRQINRKPVSSSRDESATSSADSSSSSLPSKTGKTGAIRKRQTIIFALSGLVIIVLIVFGILIFQQKDVASVPATPNIDSKTGSTVIPTVPASKIEIRDVSVTDITEKSMTIQWKTNLPATSEVSALEQKSANSVGGWPDNKLVLEHKVTLEKLTPSSSYILKVKSKDVSGNEALFESNNAYQTRPSRVTTDIIIGEKGPDFLLRTLTGENISLSAQRDKKIMLVFWLMSCSSCREELPFLQDYWENAKPEDLLLFAINIGENENLIKNYVIGQKLTFPILLDQDSAVSKKYTIVRYPTIFLLAPDKTVINIREEPFKNTGEIKDFIQSLNQPK